jgi:hypothetical protein
MERTRTFLGVRVPSGWGEIGAGLLKTTVIGFVTLVLWDWVESGDYDPAGVMSNAVMVALGLFILDAILIGTFGTDRDPRRTDR